MLGISMQKKQDPHRLYLLILQMASGKTSALYSPYIIVHLTLRFRLLLTGKTNCGIKLYGRIMRNINPCLCGVGALGFYLYFRFEKSHEMNPPPDFTVNKDWFDIKLLTDGSQENSTRVMSNESYAKGVQIVLKKLDISSKHYLHLGRILGPIQLEKLEAESRDIQSLGNWNPSTQEKFYSTKLPMRPIRALGGFQDAGGMHYNPRTVVEPPESLKSMIFPFADRSLREVREKSKVDGKDRYTAEHFLRLLIDLRAIVLQDAAAIVIAHGERQQHALFRLPVFQQPEFNVSTGVQFVDCRVEVFLTIVH
jgi:hypothetical protein